jgi:Protein of unknown function (DUF2933)
MGNYLFLLLIVACPLMMIFMMRGMHGGQGGNADGGHTQAHTADNSHGHGDTNSSLEELRRQREQLDREIEEREAEETRTPVGGGWR